LEALVLQSLSEVEDVMLRVLETLTLLHTLEMVHGAISPKSVVQDQGGQYFLQDVGGCSQGDDGACVTPMMRQLLPFTAPELFEGGVPSPQSDLFSLGATCDTLLKQLQVTFRKLGAIPSEKRFQLISRHVTRLMDPDLAMRYPNAGDALQAISRDLRHHEFRLHELMAEASKLPKGSDMQWYVDQIDNSIEAAREVRGTDVDEALLARARQFATERRAQNILSTALAASFEPIQKEKLGAKKKRLAREAKDAAAMAARGKMQAKFRALEAINATNEYSMS